MPSNHLILCCPLLPQSFPVSQSFLMSWIFTSGGRSIGASQLQHYPSNEYSELISFRIDWFDLLAVQGTFKSLLQHHSLKASILWPSVFFRLLFLYPYMTTGKTIALTVHTFVSKVMSLLFNMLSRFIIAFLSKRKCLSISWLQSPSTVILEPRKIKQYGALSIINYIKYLQNTLKLVKFYGPLILEKEMATHSNILA